jgi:hypothetical protein
MTQPYTIDLLHKQRLKGSTTSVFWQRVNNKKVEQGFDFLFPYVLFLFPLCFFGGMDCSIVVFNKWRKHKNKNKNEEPVNVLVKVPVSLKKRGSEDWKT